VQHFGFEPVEDRETHVGPILGGIDIDPEGASSDPLSDTPCVYETFNSRPKRASSALRS
jgi:hypothetical protein